MSAQPFLAFDRLEAELARGETPELPLPRVGITLLPPWWWLILWAGKRIENRSASVAGRLRTWRGLLALTSSKPPNAAWDEAVDEITGLRREGRIPAGKGYLPAGPASWTLGDAKARSGCVIGVAELLDVRANGRDPTDPWAVPGEHGLILGRIAEVEPVPCTGGRSVFRFGACGGCGKPGAVDGEGKPLVCRACKASTPFEKLGRPILKVRAIQPARVT